MRKLIVGVSVEVNDHVEGKSSPQRDKLKGVRERKLSVEVKLILSGCNEFYTFSQYRDLRENTSGRDDAIS